MMKLRDGTYYSVKEVADELCVSERTVRDFVSSGRLNANRTGRDILIHEVDLEEFKKDYVKWEKPK